MYTYIKHSIRGFYVELENALTEELYSNIGETWEDFIADKWVMLSEEQVAFKTEHPMAKIHEVWTMELDPINERTLEMAKSEMTSKIDQYDRSENVNSFSINGISTWLTVEERLNYKQSVEAAKLMRTSEDIAFFVGDYMLNVSIEAAEYMLAQLQGYADECFIVTKMHKIAVGKLETIEEVDGYDFKVNYPKRLEFTI